MAKASHARKMVPAIWDSPRMTPPGGHAKTGRRMRPAGEVVSDIGLSVTVASCPRYGLSIRTRARIRPETGSSQIRRNWFLSGPYSSST